MASPTKMFELTSEELATISVALAAYPMANLGPTMYNILGEIAGMMVNGSSEEDLRHHMEIEIPKVIDKEGQVSVERSEEIAGVLDKLLGPTMAMIVRMAQSDSYKSPARDVMEKIRESVEDEKAGRPSQSKTHGRHN